METNLLSDYVLEKSYMEEFSSSHRHGGFLFTEESNSVMPEKNSVATHPERLTLYSESGHFARRTTP